MPELKDVHSRIRDKRRQRREIGKSFKDELAHDAEYQRLVEQIDALRERKKAIEEQVRANASSDVTTFETLGLEIKADTELLADLAINRYMGGQDAVFEDEDGQRWVPAFSVKFSKDEGQTVKTGAEAERAASHLERTFVPEETRERELQPA